jgi:hypothetical protein
MKAAFAFFLSVAALLPSQARVVTYPAPLDEPLSADYQVQIGTNRVDVYSARVLDPPFAGELWCDRARIFLFGHESRAPFMRGMTLRDLDINHFTMTPFLFELGEEMRLEDVTVENVRLHGEG